MSNAEGATSGNSTTAAEHPLTVLLVDDQAIIAEAVRQMLAAESDVGFHYCSDPTKAIEMANRLEPTVILQDLVMPEIDGLTLVKFFRANPSTRDVPMIVLSVKEEPVIKAEAFAVGANDYLVKLPDKLELIARIRYHSKGYVAQLERNEAYRKLAESQKQLAGEVAQAAKYVASLLPEPIRQGPVQVDWRFVPSTQLGGDSFGYHWLDDEHFAVYFLDVSGHGVGASLLSVSALNVLRSQSLPNADFHDPAQVLARLNSTFVMEQHDGRYFTIWYGVFSKKTRQLAYAGGGHPPALVLAGAPAAATELLSPALTMEQGDQREPDFNAKRPCSVPESMQRSIKCLESQGPPIGWELGLPFQTDSVVLDPRARLFIFSDGVFEIEKTDAANWEFDDFLRFMATVPDNVNAMDHLLAHARQLHGSPTLADDFSMLELVF